MEQSVGPSPHQLSRRLHSHVGHHAQIESPLFMQQLPLAHQWIISIHQKGVIKLITQLLLQRPQAGEIHHKAAIIQSRGGKPNREAAAVAMHEAAVAWMLPLPMTAGIALKLLTAGVGGGRQ